MSRKDEAPLLSGHDYDGIQEYDNPLPVWWLVTFFGTIIFAFIYWVHYEFGGGMTQYAELQADLAQIDGMRLQQPVPTSSESELESLIGQKDVMDRGRVLFAEKCAACHGVELQGLIGPNLTDSYWISGKGRLKDIDGLIRVGVAAKGMPPWDGVLPSKDIQALTVFVASAKGSNPPDPKAPQGEKVDD